MDNRPNLNKPEKSNSGKTQNWLLFDKSFKWQWGPLPGVFGRVALATELWHKTYKSAKTGDETRVYRIIGIDLEEDQQDKSLKLLNFTILGFIFSIGLY